MKKLLAFTLAGVMALSTAGCGGKKTSSKPLPSKINELAENVKTLDEMPDWEGDKLNVSVWYGYGVNEEYIGKKAKNDKFRDELERITGIRFDEDASFDNGGQSGDTRLARIVSSKKWPMVGIGIENAIVERLIESDKLYDLMDLIPKYMPHYYQYIKGNDIMEDKYKNTFNKNGRKYGISHLSMNAFRYTDPEYTPEKYSAALTTKDSATWIWVRDDILTTLYPNAKTQQQLLDKYMKNGSFDEEDFNDVVIRSRDEFKDFLTKIRDLNITENGKKVWPFYTHNGSDNWYLMTVLESEFVTGMPSNGQYSYFDYFNAETEKVTNPMKEEPFKESIKFYTQLIKDGIASDEALIDNNTTWTQKKENGEYAVIYGGPLPPTDEQLKAAGKNFSYRKVKIDVPTNPKYAGFDANAVAFDGYSEYFFKDSMTETQLEQYLRAMDMFYTDAGRIFSEWGPKDAGIWEYDEKGNMKYIDKKWRTARVDDGDKTVLVDYGLCSFPRVDHLMAGGALNKYDSRLVYATYDDERSVDSWKKAWNNSFYEPMPDYEGLDFTWAIWNFPQHVEGVKTFWNARQETEDAIKKVFTATSDKQFDQLFDDLIRTIESNGFDDKCFEEMTKAFKKQNSKSTYEAFIKQAKSMLK